MTAPSIPSRRPPRRRLLVILALAIPAIVILLAIVSISIGEGGRPLKITGASETQLLYGGILQNGDVLGSADAPVTITYFTDLQNPDSAEYHFTTIPPLIEEFVRDGEVKLALRHFSTAENTTQTAAFAATAAGEQERQWQYANLFFINQPEPGERITIELLRGVAGAVLEFDESDWEQDFDADEVRTVVESDNQEGIELLLSTDPAMIVEGPSGATELQDAPSLDEIEAAVAGVS
ncbi:MAG: DsbA family protein [Solirubrobacterales bacterium]